MRKTGYYWIKIPYPNNGKLRWEVGSWDANVELWLLVGSKDPRYSDQLLDIGQKIEPPKEAR